ncbi:MAG: restriction endonuclease subunit S [Cyanobacteria bacterium J06560_6]
MSFPKYEAYKDSGVEWLGEVPGHWHVEALKYYSHVFPSNVDKKSYEGQFSVLLCNYTDVYYNEKIVEGMNFMSATATNEQIEKFELQAGDVIFTKDSESADDIAIASYVPESLPGVICGYHLSMIRPGPTADGEFIKRFFDSHSAKAYFAVSANGLTRMGLSQYSTDNVPTPIPPLEEQKQIAQFLDYETARINTLITEQQRLIELLKEKRQAVISHAVTKGLDPTVPMKDSGVEWLGEVPKHWSVRKAHFLFEEQRRPVREIDGIVTVFRDGQVCLRSRRRETGFTMADLEQGYQGIRRGDLVIHSMDAFAGAIGVSEDDGRSTPEYVVVQPYDREMNCEYFAHALRLMAERNYIFVLCQA